MKVVGHVFSLVLGLAAVVGCTEIQPLDVEAPGSSRAMYSSLDDGLGAMDGCELSGCGGADVVATGEYGGEYGEPDVPDGSLDDGEYGGGEYGEPDVPDGSLDDGGYGGGEYGGEPEEPTDGLECAEDEIKICPKNAPCYCAKAGGPTLQCGDDEIKICPMGERCYCKKFGSN